MLSWSAGGIAAKQVLFLDRDGVINHKIDDGYVLDFDRDFRFIDAFFDVIRPFKAIPLAIISNQSCVGRGLLSGQELHEIMRRMLRELEKRRIEIAAYFICPHSPQNCCNCRKPSPGLLLSGARRLAADLSSSAFIGDSTSDVEAGGRAGCPTFRVTPDCQASYAAAFKAAYDQLSKGGSSWCVR